METPVFKAGKMTEGKRETVKDKERESEQKREGL